MLSRSAALLASATSFLALVMIDASDYLLAFSRRRQRRARRA